MIEVGTQFSKTTGDYLVTPKTILTFLKKQVNTWKGIADGR